MQVKKILSVCMAALMSVTLCSCAPFSDSKAEVKQAISAEFDGLKNLDDTTITELDKTGELDELKNYGIDTSAFLKAALSGFDYKIDEDSIEVDGDSAKANISVTTKDMASIAKAAQEEFLTEENVAKLYQLYSSDGEEAIAKDLLTLLMNKLNETKETVQTDVTLELQKVDGTWQITDNSFNQLNQELFNVNFPETTSQSE